MANNTKRHNLNKIKKPGKSPLTVDTATWRVINGSGDPNLTITLFGPMLDDSLSKGSWTRAVATPEITIWKRHLSPKPVNNNKKPTKSIATWRVRSF